MRYLSLTAFIISTALCARAQETHPVIAPPAAQHSEGPAQAKPVETTPSGTSSPNYIISTGDVLDLSVWKEPSMSGTNLPVRPDGKISLPLLGDVPAAGMTPMMLSEDISGRLKKYITQPLVTITVTSVRPKEIYLIGEVQKTGPVILTPGMSTLQAISAAGGLTSFAKKKLYILRKYASGEQKIPYDYKKAIKTGDQQGIVLQPGDTIVAP